MGLLAGLTLTAVCLAVALKLMKHAKRVKDRQKAPKLYRIAAIVMFLGGCGAVGTNLSGVATSVASHLPAALVVFAAVFCALGVVLDCIGKENHAGRGTVVIALFVPLLIVVAPVSLLGINPDDLVASVRDVTQQSQVVQTTGN